MTSRAPRVSVVMPVFNGERYVAEAVQSVLASQFNDLELLLLDDGSTDRSVAEAVGAAAGDERLRVVSLPHGGVAAARNAGLAEARGELIANLDADDAMFPDRLSRQVGYLDRNPGCVAVGSRALVVDAKGRAVRVGVRHLTHEEIDGAHLDGRGGAIWNPTATFRKAVALAVGGYWSELQTTGEDYDLWLRMAEVGRLANLPEVLVRYRVHDANVSLDKTDTERRLAVGLATLRRAFDRRGMTDRPVVRRSGAPASVGERWADRALLRYFSGDRMGAGWRAMLAVLLRPTAPATRSALRTIFGSHPGGA